MKLPKNRWRLLRRLAQVLFLLAFLWLFRRTESDGTPEVMGSVNLLFRLDPLVAASAVLAGKTFIAALLPAAILAGLTLVLGRFFCGWVCPLGTLIDGARRIIPRRERPAGRGWRRGKYIVLAAVLAAALGGLDLAGLVDPFSILFRGLACAVDPGLTALVAAPFDWAFRSAPESVSEVTEGVYGFLKDHFLPFKAGAYRLAGVSLGLLAAVLVLERFGRRFWCRNLCPAGGLFALLARPALLRRSPPVSCKGCGRCESDCRMGAFGDEGKLSPEECNLCLDCLDDCPKGIAAFRLKRSGPKPAPVDASRRLFLGAAGTGIVLAAASRLDGRIRGEAAVLRPPGAPGEDRFLALCVRCGECLKVCPTNGLQLAALESGWEGLFSPVLDTRHGYCEYNCSLCGQVCPTGAIPRLDEAGKHAVRIGMAEFDTDRCLPFARGEACIVCEEHCPTPEKAIQFIEVDAVKPSGEKVRVKRPYVVLERCVGCGICENKCPLLGEAGIRVVPVGRVAATKEMLAPPPGM